MSQLILPNGARHQVTRYYHGGVRRLKPNMLILPPDRTGAVSCRDTWPDDSQVDKVLARTDRVYVTTDLQVATLWGAMFPHRKGGWVYEVEPSPDLEIDPDYQGDDQASWQCSYASIIAGQPVSLAMVHKAKDHFGVRR